jgi:type III secretion system (T3SS) SseB-like protein
VAPVDHDRTLAPSPFPGDDGSASAETRDALARSARDSTPTAYLKAVVALCTDRLLVPVVATATRMGETTSGLTSDKEAEMAVVMLRTPDSRQAMVAFTGLDSLAAWQPAARPVPITIDRLAATARDEGATAVLVDVAGPAALVIEGEVLEALAAGHRLVETTDGGFGWAVPAPE